MISTKERLEQDRIGQLRYAKDEGRVEGRVERNLEVARNLLALGTSLDVVQEATGLSIEQLHQLQDVACNR